MKKKEMSIRSNILTLNKPKEKVVGAKKTTKFAHSLEYEIIANLVLQQYEKEGNIRFDLLYAISPADRISALSKEYGNKRMYQLLVTLLREFSISVPLPKTKKLNDTRINVCACDLMINAQEEALSMEDLILFFERTKKGNYGAIKKYLTHQLIKEKLEIYLADRQDAFSKLAEERNLSLKALGPAKRTCEEPKQIGEILKQASVIDMTTRMSG